MLKTFLIAVIALGAISTTARAEHSDPLQLLLDQANNEKADRARGADKAQTEQGLKCSYSGKRQIIQAQGCAQVCYAEVSCEKIEDGKTIPTTAVCKAVAGACPGANTCVDDPDVTLGRERVPGNGGLQAR